MSSLAFLILYLKELICQFLRNNFRRCERVSFTVTLPSLSLSCSWSWPLMPLWTPSRLFCLSVPVVILFVFDVNSLLLSHFCICTGYFTFHSLFPLTRYCIHNLSQNMKSLGKMIIYLSYGNTLVIIKGLTMRNWKITMFFLELV